MRVFISHVSADQELATELASRLEKAGFDVFSPAEQILPGDNWALKIGRALQEADAMLVLLSPVSVSSESIRRDIGFAIANPNYENRLIPIYVGEVQAEEAPWIVRTMQSVRIGRDPGAAARRIAEILQTATATVSSS